MFDIRLLCALATKTSLLTFEEFLVLREERPGEPRKLIDAVKSERLRVWLAANPDWPEDAVRMLDWIERRGAQLTYPGRADYPEGLLELEDPPLALSYLGSPFWRSARMLSVVGSRSPERASLTWMDLVLAPLVREGIALVSGGARGVDQRAHAICVRTSRPTGAFLPSGLARPYPESFEEWIDEIVGCGGAILSELDPRSEMRKHYFLKRNRMIAAICSTTLVVEARRQSGTMITARLAGTHGNTVAVMPGLPTNPQWAGSLDLICAGAVPVRDTHDLRLLLDAAGAAGTRARALTPSIR